jgi:hypothetical protein
MISNMSNLRDEVLPQDHTPKAMSSLRTAVVKLGKTIMELGGRGIVRTFWKMLEDLDEGVIERLAATKAKKKQVESIFPLDRLPDDLITTVCHYLDADTLMSLSQTSHRYQKMADDPLTWKHAVLTLYKDMPEGYNNRIDNRGGRYLFDRVQRVHIDTAYLPLENNGAHFVRYQEHNRYRLFTWNLVREALPLLELVCPCRLMTNTLLDVIKAAPAQLEILRLTGSGVVLGSDLECEFAATMVAHKGSLRELDAIHWLPLHVYFERVGQSDWDGIKKICDGLRSMVHLEKISLPLVRTRSSTLMVDGFFEHSNVNLRDLSQFKDSIPDMDMELAGERRTCELLKGANSELVEAARRLPNLQEVLYVLHAEGSIVDTIVDTLELYLREDDPGQETLRLISFEQRPEDTAISVNSYDDTPKLVMRVKDDDMSGDKEVLEVLGDDLEGNMRKYLIFLLEAATGRFITTACSFFERYPHVHLKIQLQGDYWNKMFDDVVLPNIPAELQHRLSFLENKLVS